MGLSLPIAKQKLAREAYQRLGSYAAVERETGIHKMSVRKYATDCDDPIVPDVDNSRGACKEKKQPPKQSFTDHGNSAIATGVSDKPIRTIADAIAAAQVDTKAWTVEKWEVSDWTVPMKVEQGQDASGRWKAAKPIQTQQYGVKLFLKRLTPKETAGLSLLEEFKKHGLVLPKYQGRPTKYGQGKHAQGRALELSVMDPHLGMRCFKPQSDATWSLDECEQMFMATVERLLAAASSYGPFDEIVTAFGNDYLHADNVWHETTGGTQQPEMDSLHETYLRGKKLAIWQIERLRKVGPVRVIHVPGNHDRLTSFTMAMLLKAFYEGAKATDVTVECSPSPYKFWHYGVNLIGFEHGHSVKPIRLAALMANETRLSGWKEARYCEWHLGDQHRKGSGKPSMHEEQGVSVEYLPALTPPNEWHRLKSFNWQKRGGMAFVYDKNAGPIARLQVNFDSYHGGFMGNK